MITEHVSSGIYSSYTFSVIIISWFYLFIYNPIYVPSDTHMCFDFQSKTPRNSLPDLFSMAYLCLLISVRLLIFVELLYMVLKLGNASRQWVLFNSEVVSDSVTPWHASLQASMSFTILWSLFTLMSIGTMMLSNHLILFHPLLLLF